MKEHKSELQQKAITLEHALNQARYELSERAVEVNRTCNSDTAGGFLFNPFLFLYLLCFLFLFSFCFFLKDFCSLKNWALSKFVSSPLKAPQEEVNKGCTFCVWFNFVLGSVFIFLCFLLIRKNKAK